MSGIDPNKPYGGVDYERDLQDHRATTNAILNETARHAGALVPSDGVSVHGDDETYEAMSARFRGEGLKTGASDVVNEGIHLLIERRLDALELPALDAAFAIATPLGAGYELLKGTHEAWLRGNELSDALIRDGMHLAAAEAVCGMPACYVEKLQAERPNAAAGEHGLHAKMVEDLMKPENKAARDCLQSRADEGMKAACDFVRIGGRGTAAFLNARGLEKRYGEDAAFHAGFDAMVLAADKSPAQFEKARTELESRDARLGLTQVFKG